ncbi:YfhJ family protein [Radiobacillus sp. PE A8.2]|uniref:YfhJ family protein n=1 Tax=Radiobacillus sp. PE A8.2 TaxID=3380349 RepID=UPI00388F8DE7
MQENFERLATQLLEQNDSLTKDEAQTWVELLWEDFDATRAKAGRQYEGKEVTEQVVRKWIENYGSRLHEFVQHNPKYQQLFNRKSIQ